MEENEYLLYRKKKKERPGYSGASKEQSAGKIRYQCSGSKVFR